MVAVVAVFDEFSYFFIVIYYIYCCVSRLVMHNLNGKKMANLFVKDIILNGIGEAI